MLPLFLILSLALTLAPHRTADASGLQILLQHEFRGKPLTLGAEPYHSPQGDFVSFSRLDYLLSQIAFQPDDTDSWIPIDPSWHGLVRLSEGKTLIQVPSPPAGSYRALRFHIGTHPEVASADPNTFPSGHPLHPLVNGLHWGWQGGYIHLALEGHRHLPDGLPAASQGFSYHLANQQPPMTVEIACDFEAGRHRALEIVFDLQTLFRAPDGLQLDRDALSTHSRPRDTLAEQLKGLAGSAFHFRQALTDRYQMPSSSQAAPSGDLTDPKAPAVGTPYLLRLSSRFPQVTLPPDNPLTIEGVQLGERLFHEPRLSRDHQRTCASCHHRGQAFADDPARRVSLGIENRPGSRNAMPLFNLAWKKAFLWDGSVPSLRQQVLAPVVHPHEMGETLDGVATKLQKDPDYVDLFTAAFASSTISPENMARALEQYLHTLISQDAKFDRAARGETRLTDEEQRGLELFITEHDPDRGLFGADCFHCHGGNLFTSNTFANNGLALAPDDLGLAAVTGHDADKGKFVVPSLRNIAATAPYMHDGRMGTLEEVVAHYDRGLTRSPSLDPNLAKHPAEGMRLSPADQKALVAFLHTLTDDSFLHPPAPVAAEVSP